LDHCQSTHWRPPRCRYHEDLGYEIQQSQQVRDPRIAYQMELSIGFSDPRFDMPRRLIVQLVVSTVTHSSNIYIIIFSFKYCFVCFGCCNNIFIEEVYKRFVVSLTA
jgi:hypothetical protein